jgi:hypothetical protein
MTKLALLAANLGHMGAPHEIRLLAAPADFPRAAYHATSLRLAAMVCEDHASGAVYIPDGDATAWLADA